MSRNRAVVQAVTVVALTVGGAAMSEQSAQSATTLRVASVSAAEYRHIDNGMTKTQVHAAVGGAAKSTSNGGKVETYRGWDHGRHALVQVTYRTKNGKLVVAGKKTKTDGGNGGGNGGGGGGYGGLPIGVARG